MPRIIPNNPNSTGTYRIEAGITAPSRNTYPTIAACLAATSKTAPIEIVLAPRLYEDPHIWDGANSGLTVGETRSITIYAIRWDTLVQLKGEFPAADEDAAPALHIEEVSIELGANTIIGANRNLEIRGLYFDGNDFSITTENSYNYLDACSAKFISFKGVPGTSSGWEIERSGFLQHGSTVIFDIIDYFDVQGCNFILDGVSASARVFNTDGTAAASVYFQGSSIYINSTDVTTTMFNAGTGGEVAVWGSTLIKDLGDTGVVNVKNALADYLGPNAMLVYP